MTDTEVGESEADRQDRRDLGRAYWLAGVVLLAVVLLWVATPFAVKAIVGQTLDQRGQFGDLYGSINALFSGLAFAGVIIAILLQRRELELQRRELRYTRTEMKASVAAQDGSQRALNKTIYANSFKVALDILDEPTVIASRRYVYERRKSLESGKKELWGGELSGHADLVIRTFEAVGTMIRNGLLPQSYILDSWSVAIVRCWTILQDYLAFRREERQDPFIGKDFEELAAAARRFLNEQGVKNPV
jgi:hypothetical protein